jgi:hypothetical protein
MARLTDPRRMLSFPSLGSELGSCFSITQKRLTHKGSEKQLNKEEVHKVLSQIISVLLRGKMVRKTLLELRKRSLHSDSRFFPILKMWEALHKQQNAFGQIKALKINAYMITHMFDFIAQRKFLWVFRKFASDLTAGYFRK